MQMKKYFKNITKTIKFVSEIDSFLIPLCVVCAILQGVSPYINTIMISRILNKLLNNAPIKELILLAIITTAINTIMHLLITCFGYIKEWRIFYFRNHYKMMKTKKYFTVDYSLLESSDFENIRQGVRYSDDNMGTIDAIINQIQRLFSTMISVIATLIIMSSLFSKFIIIGHTSLVYSVISITILSLVSFVLTFLTAKIQKRNERILPQLFEKLTDVNRKAMYLASNIVYNYSIGKDIRIYNVSGLINKEMEEASEKFAPYLKRISKVSNIPSVLGNASSAIIGGIIFIIVGLYAKLGYFEIGDVYLYAGTIQQFIGSVTSMVFAIGELNVINSRLTQSYKLLNMPDGYIHNENITVDEFQNIPSEFEIIFDDVSFHYPDSKNWALKNISFKISTTERIAIVGTNGAGKTTVIKLLCRLYTPTEGRILINNIDINTIPMEQYMRIISVVFQDFKLFSFSIGQNLSLSESYDINKALEVLKDSGFYDRLQNLSNGTDSFIYNDYAEDGIEISGGEAQKIAIARLLYANSPIVILDEPTAALDPKAEAEIFEKFNDIITNKTAIYISHRLSSCKFSDRIFVFDKGELVQHGKHEQLVLQDGGLYKTLWESQSKYYKDHTQLINM